MDEHALTVKTVRDGPVCALILAGELNFSETGGFLVQAALAVDDQTERLVLDLDRVTFLECAAVRALAVAASFAPGRCPVIIGSLSPMAPDRRATRPGCPDLPASLLRATNHKAGLGLATSQQEP